MHLRPRLRERAEMKRLLHLLPRVPPAICGVGDQTTYLAETLLAEHGIESEFLVAGHELGSPQELWPKLEAQSNRADAVTIQYSCYGFQKRGIPFHLIRAVKRLRQSQPNLPVLTMFHELAAHKRGGNYRGAFAAGSCAYVLEDTAEVRGIQCDRVFERQERDHDRAVFCGKGAKFHW